MAGFLGDGLMPFMDIYSVMRRMKEGDLIEFDRGIYSHWGVCVGKDEIVHVTGSAEAVFSSFSALSSSSGIDLLWDPDTKEVVVKHQHLRGIVEDGGKARINNKTTQAREKGLWARRPTDVVADCKRRVGDRLVYNLTSSNCEHFATRMKYGKAWSDQVKDTVKGLAVVGGGIALGVGIFAALNSLLAASKKDDHDNDDDDDR